MIKDSLIKEVDFINLINLLNSLKMALIISTIAFILILIFINDRLNSNSNSIIQFKKIMLNFFRFKMHFKHPVSKIGLILIFYNIFLMFFRSILTNNIKTSHVLVDTSNLGIVIIFYF